MYENTEEAVQGNVGNRSEEVDGHNEVCGSCTDIQAPVPACMVRCKANQETNRAKR